MQSKTGFTIGAIKVALLWRIFMIKSEKILIALGIIQVII